MDTGSTEKMTLIKFWAPWCSPCLAMKPTVDRALTDSDNIELISINIDEDVEKAREYRIRQIPTLLLLKDNSEIDRLVGNHSVERVKEFLKR